MWLRSTPPGCEEKEENGLAERRTNVTTHQSAQLNSALERYFTCKISQQGNRHERSFTLSWAVLQRCATMPRAQHSDLLSHSLQARWPRNGSLQHTCTALFPSLIWTRFALWNQSTAQHIYWVRINPERYSLQIRQTKILRMNLPKVRIQKEQKPVLCLM